MTRELVRNPCVIDYGTLEGVLSHDKIFPCDIDGLVEVQGNLLFIETKFHDEELPEGQRRMLETLAKIPGCKVFVIEIENQKTSKGAHWFIPKQIRQIHKDNIPSVWKPCTLKEWNVFYVEWYKNAFSRPFVRR